MTKKLVVFCVTYFTLTLHCGANLKSPSDKKYQLSKAQLESSMTPFITFYDEELTSVYNWWAENKQSELSDFHKYFDKNVKRVLHKLKWVHASKSKIPRSYQKTKLTLTDYAKIARGHKSKYFVVGDIRFKKSPVKSKSVRVQVNLTAHFSYNAQVVANTLSISDVSYDEVEGLSLKPKNFMTRSIWDLERKIIGSESVVKNHGILIYISGQLNQAQLNAISTEIKKDLPGVSAAKWISHEMGMAHLEVVFNAKKTLMVSPEDLERYFSGLSVGELTSQLVSAKIGRYHLDFKPI